MKNTIEHEQVFQNFIDDYIYYGLNKYDFVWIENNMSGKMN